MFGDATTLPVNLGADERLASLLGGLALLVIGLSRPSLGRCPLAVAGGALLQRRLSGRWPLYHRLRAGTGRPIRDAVDGAFDDSFSASDPPSSTPVSALGGRVAHR